MLSKKNIVYYNSVLMEMQIVNEKYFGQNEYVNAKTEKN